MSNPARLLKHLLLAVSGAALVLAGCAAPTPSPAVPSPAAASPAASTAAPRPSGGGIQFMVMAGPAVAPAYQALVARYEQLHPNQAVTLVTLSNAADYQRRLATDFASGAAADVLLVSYLSLAGLASHGLLAPVAPYLAGSRVLREADFYGQALDPFFYNRQVECVPQNISGLVVYYNKNLFQQAGLSTPRTRWTWDDFLAYARTLTHVSGATTAPAQYGLGIEPTLTNLAPFIWQADGRLVNDAYWPTELALNSPAVLTATNWLVSLQTQYHVTPDAQAELAASSEERFVDGTLGMLVNSRQGVPDYRRITAFDWDVAALPTRNGRTTNVAVADGYCLTAASSNKPAAWQLIEFAASSEGQAILARSGAVVPSMPAVARSSAFLDPSLKPAHNQVFLDAISQASDMPMLENWSDIQAIADEELQQAFYGHKDVAAALSAATLRSEEYFRIHSAH